MSNRKREDQIMMRNRAGSEETRNPGNAQLLLSNLVTEVLKLRSEAIQKQAILSALLLQEVQRAIVEQTASQSRRASQQPVLSTSPLDANRSNANIKNLAREEASTAKHLLPCPRTTEKFPKTLYRMLIDASLQNNDHIVCFAPSGKVFFIRDPQAFESEILPHYFYHGKLPSFRRQLNLYGFRLLSHGAEAGGYAHAVFDRENRQVSESISRAPTTSKSSNARRK